MIPGEVWAMLAGGILTVIPAYLFGVSIGREKGKDEAVEKLAKAVRRKIK